MHESFENDIRSAASILFDENHDKLKPVDLLSAADTQEALNILRKDAALLANPSYSKNFDNSTFPFITFDSKEGSLSITEGLPDGARTIKAKPYSVEVTDEMGAKAYTVKESAERLFFEAP